jgi:hypothetical protein
MADDDDTQTGNHPSEGDRTGADRRDRLADRAEQVYAAVSGPPALRWSTKRRDDHRVRRKRPLPVAGRRLAGCLRGQL